MSRIALAFVAMLAASPAMAADVAEDLPAAPVVAQSAAYDWNGGYIGVQKGASWLNADLRLSDASAHENFNGFTLGTFAGYNFMYENFVVGVEGDLSYNWNENHYRAFGQKNDVGTDWGASLRGRLGYSFDRTLVYATGGWASTRAFIDSPSGDGDRTYNGWTLGGGVDWAVLDDVFVRAEYRYVDYGNRNINGVKVDLDQHQALIGVAYKF